MIKNDCVSPLTSRFVCQASLVAPSSQSEDVLDLEQVTLQEVPLPPPIQRVMDPGQFTYGGVVWTGQSLWSLAVNINIFFQSVAPGFSDSEAAALTADTADLVDKLDLSVSSIDMTDTALAMHEDKDCDISGIGELNQSQIRVSESIECRSKGCRDKTVQIWYRDITATTKLIISCRSNHNL